MVLDVMKLRAQVRWRNSESPGEIVFQIANPGGIPQTIRDLSEHSAAVAIRSWFVVERGHPARIFFRDRRDVLLAAYCRLPTAYYFFCCSRRRKQNLPVQVRRRIA